MTAAERDNLGAEQTSKSDTPCNVRTLMNPPPERACGARTRAGTPCRNWTVWGRPRCRLHGGKSYAGIASPRFKHGRYSLDPIGHLLWEFGFTRKDEA